MLSPAVMWGAAKRTGQLKVALLHPGTPDEREIDVKYKVRPRDEFDGAATAVTYSMQYRIEDGPDVANGVLVEILGNRYTCRNPDPVGNSDYEMLVRLTEVLS